MATNTRLNKKFTLAPMAAALALASSMANADVILDPYSSGATQVFPNLATSPISTSQINVGYLSFPGAVEINADASSNGVTAIGGSALLVGQENGADGLVRIVGDGSSGSASATISNGVGARIGFGGTGRLEVLNGGLLESNENIHLGEDVSGAIGDATVIVDGVGSEIRSTVDAANFSGGRVSVPFGRADADLTVSNGGLVEAVGGDISQFDDGAIYIGTYSEDFAGTVNVTVTGAGSTMRAENGIYVLNELGGTSVSVENGGLLETVEENLDFGDGPEASIAIGSLTADGAMLDVRGAGSQVSAFGGIDIGYERSIIGFSGGGEPRSRYSDDGKVAGDQVVDLDGAPIFDEFGDPVYFVEVDLGGFLLLVPENTDLAGGTTPRVKTTGRALVEDSASVVAGSDINIGSNNADPSVQPLSGQDSSLTVRTGATVTAENLFVNEHGILQGDGGLIDANVELAGGTISPGDSPGTLSIIGDLNLYNGLLELEIGDRLDVTGDVFLGSGLDMLLIFGVNPAFGETISLSSYFNVTGNMFGTFNPFTNLSFEGLGSNAYFNVMGFEGEQLVVGSPDPVDVPEPSAFSLLALSMTGLMSLKLRQRAKS